MVPRISAELNPQPGPLIVPPNWESQVPPTLNLTLPIEALFSYQEWAYILARKVDVLPKCCDALDRLYSAVLRLYNNGFDGVEDGIEYLYALVDALRLHPDLDRSDYFDAIASEVRSSLILYARGQVDL